MKIKQYLVISLCLICMFFPFYVVSEDEMNICEYDQTEINRELYSIKYERKESPYLALDYLKDRMPCVKTKEDEALFKQSIAGVWIDIYKKDKTRLAASNATKLLLEAIKLDTKYTNQVKLRLAYLLYHKKDYERATGLVNNILSTKLEKPGPYLALGLDIEVARGHWETAREIVNLVFRYDQTVFLMSHHFLSAVQTLCHFNEYDNAKKFIYYFEEQQPELYKTENSEKRLKEAKDLLEYDCK